ncbi:MAG: aldoketomutase [Candidatus Pacebacteria bacterium CG10_big_fil_rev_8_21_14_0_10_36_11]|nr:VOC family protein [Candidatus Pacearchaeota archaeon]OIP73990.1 MAG: aldoketomutase [Candidatus Pacebacteria bacterium CG2_30_36_39]PIR64371.1 MAG: aldoketomutase [Candidatus Pacebacteria bacterium CG10_big_fil_rev_8_21_14_0_10_36_11]PJC43067.1 MAG: aldoketomutase [Candidatus Pacebacteria bacterium CG_4_9_14_0_2_um_filter_36_8]
MNDLVFNSLIPELSVSSFKNSLDFYCNILGFKIEYQRKADKFALISLEGSQLMIEEINNHWQVGEMQKPFGRGVNFQIEVKKIQPLLASLAKNNLKLFKETMENWYRQDDKLLGNKEFLIQDPDGYLLRFSEDLGKKNL